jgi:single-strand DNA-binding protein
VVRSGEGDEDMDAYVQLTGNVGGTVEFRNNGVPVASFRLAHTPRVRRNGEWVDAATTWITVTCFRALAENVTASIHKGQPVLVAGRLRTNVWTKEGVTYERLTLEATTVGHDLTRGTATFFRTRTDEAHEDRDLSLGEVIGRVESQPVAGLDDAEVAAMPEPTDEDGDERIDEDGVVSRVA